MNSNFFRTSVTITPAITANAAYAAGNQMGPAATILPNVVPGPKGVTLLQSIEIIDADNQKSAIDFLFWSTLPTVTGSDKAAFAITTAELKLKLMAVYSVASGDYVSIGSVQGIACKGGLVVPVQSIGDTNNPDGKAVYVSLICRGTPTYTTTSSLEIRFKFQ